MLHLVSDRSKGWTLDIVDPDVVCASPLYSDRLDIDVIKYVFNDVKFAVDE